MIGRAASFAACALLLGATTVAADAQQRRPRGALSANPSAIVSAELAFARLAREKGQWTAFRETAEKDAVMFVPDAVNAQAWLRKRADPPESVSWRPERVFVSCDGTYALSTGPWSGPNDTAGSFYTVWRRQKNGDYKWVLDFGTTKPAPAQEEGVIEGKVATCAGGPRPDRRGDDPARDPVLIANPPPLSGEGQSADGSLRWRWAREEKNRVFELFMRQADGEQSVLRVIEPVAETAP